MRSSLAVVLVALQALTAGLVVVLLVGRNGSSAAVDQKIDEWNAKVQGVVNQMRQIVNSLETLRATEAARRTAPGTAGVDDTTAPVPSAAQDVPGAGASAAPLASAPPKVFPEAAEALAKLKELEHEVRDDLKSSNPRVTSLEAERDKAKAALVDRGNGAVYVVGGEIDLQPFQKGRDPKFIVYLLDEVVPAFGAVAKD